jgi:hypothetical protein
MANEIAVLAANTTNRTADIVGIPQAQYTAPAFEAITVLAPVRFDPTTGKFRNGNGTTSTEANIYGLASKTAIVGGNVTAVRRGIVYGLDLSALNFGDPVYVSDTDGRLSTVAGTTSVLVGRVVPHFGVMLGDTPQKCLLVDL